MRLRLGTSVIPIFPKKKTWTRAPSAGTMAASCEVPRVVPVCDRPQPAFARGRQRVGCRSTSSRGPSHGADMKPLPGGLVKALCQRIGAPTGGGCFCNPRIPFKVMLSPPEDFEGGERYIGLSKSVRPTELAWSTHPHLSLAEPATIGNTQKGLTQPVHRLVRRK